MAKNPTLKVTEVCKGVLHVETETQYELTSTLMRLQEFYESPYEEIRGHFFTHERYMDICAFGNKRSAQDRTVFSYLEDWNGFNVPGHIFEQWADLFAEHYLWEKEKRLINLVHKAKKTDKFYLIGTNREGARGDFEHELSHAWYYLDEDYKKEQHNNIKKLSETVYKQLSKNLEDDGYVPTVFEDEIIAYLATNLMTDTKDMLENVRVPWQTVYEFQRTFVDYKEKYFDKDY